MLRALADGESDPVTLSAMGDKRLQATSEELQAMSPGNDESAGKRRSGKTPKGNK